MTKVGLDIVPMRLPEAELSLLPIQQVQNDLPVSGQNLLLIPGEISELQVNLENRESSLLQVYLNVSGNFPLNWYQGDPEGIMLEPRERKITEIYFETPNDFFNEIVHEGETLKLDYWAQLDLYGNRLGNPSELLEMIQFNLYVRPRCFYLEYLPEIYREVDFVGRFLKIFQEALDPSFDIFNRQATYLDPLTSPESMLMFLSHWVGWKPLPYLSLNNQRRLLRNAIEIYLWRGTRRGLRFYLHILTGLPLDENIANEDDKHIGIYEFFTRGLVLGEAFLGKDSILGGGRPFHFTVYLRPDSANQMINEELIRVAIEREKPAFCTYELYITPKNN